MRENGKKKEGQRNVLPPQIFNGETYRGVSKCSLSTHAAIVIYAYQTTMLIT